MMSFGHNCIADENWLFSDSSKRNLNAVLLHKSDYLSSNTHWSCSAHERNIVVYSAIPCTWNVVYELELAETWKKCIVYVGGMRICLWTAATDRHTVHPQAIYEYGGPRWNDIDREKPVILQKYSDLGVMPTTGHLQSCLHASIRLHFSVTRHKENFNFT
jgi:hypothetical protein